MTGTQALEQAAVEYAIYTKPAPKGKPNSVYYRRPRGIDRRDSGGFGERFLELKKKSGIENSVFIRSTSGSSDDFANGTPVCRRGSRIVVCTPPRGVHLRWARKLFGYHSRTRLTTHLFFVFLFHPHRDSGMDCWQSLSTRRDWTSTGIALLREPWLKFKGIYRVLLIVPWAISTTSQR